MGTIQFAVNQFGYVGGGFRRRFLLLPTDAAAAFRAGSYMFVSLSAVVLIPVAAILWCVFAPMPVNGALLAMLLGTSLSTLFLFHGLALWTSLLGARRGKFNHTFGNDLSFAGNVVVMGGMFGLLLGPQMLGQGVCRKGCPRHTGTPRPSSRRLRRYFAISSRCRLTTALFSHEGGRVNDADGREGMSSAWIRRTDAIRITNLVKHYGAVTAVENLSLTVRPGRIFGFLGPNGSGKSTTIGCLTGILDPSAGSIRDSGTEVPTPRMPLSKSASGVMPETLGLFDPLYAHEFLAFVARMFGLDEAHHAASASANCWRRWN